MFWCTAKSSILWANSRVLSSFPMMSVAHSHRWRYFWEEAAAKGPAYGDPQPNKKSQQCRSTALDPEHITCSSNLLAKNQLCWQISAFLNTSSLKLTHLRPLWWFINPAVDAKQGHCGLSCPIINCWLSTIPAIHMDTSVTRSPWSNMF